MLDHFRAEFGWIWERCRYRFRSAIALSLAMKALNLIVLAPLAAVILRYCLTRWGRVSVGNFELVSFFVSPLGVAALLGVGTILVASQYLELSGLVRLLANDELHWWQAFKSSTGLFHRLVQLGLRQLALYLALAVPFLVAVALVYWRFWSGKDLNGLIILKPPDFWWGAGLAGAIAAGYALVALCLFLRWIYAVPILTLEPAIAVSAALQTSVRRSRGTLLRSAMALAVWAGVQGLLAVVWMGIWQLAWEAILSRSSSSLTTVVLVTGIALAMHAILATVLGALASVTFAAVVLWLYSHVAPEGVLRDRTLGAQAPHRRSFGWLLGGALLAGVTLAVVLVHLAIGDLALDEPLEITAHRAGAANAPENTVAALKQAIADRADWAEIDVQLTSDEALIVMHDIDLARVGGGNRPVNQATLAEIQALDVGTLFGKQFSGERIPTLKDIVAAAGDKIRLNVELKPHGKSDIDELTRRVIEELRGAKVLKRCRLCSQSYESLQLARQLEPGLPVGYIVATAIGDPTNLDVNFLMVKDNLATRKFVDRARVRNIPVHAWTVNDPALLAPLLDAGVANVITDDPARMRVQLDELRALTTAERLLLRVRHAIAP